MGEENAYCISTLNNSSVNEVNGKNMQSYSSNT